MAKRLSTMSYALQGRPSPRSGEISACSSCHAFWSPWFPSLWRRSWDEPLPQQPYLRLQPGHAAVPGGASQVLWDGKSVKINLTWLQFGLFIALFSEKQLERNTKQITFCTDVSFFLLWFYFIFPRSLPSWDKRTVSSLQCESSLALQGKKIKQSKIFFYIIIIFLLVCAFTLPLI